jgi:hypothetical protein
LNFSSKKTDPNVVLVFVDELGVFFSERPVYADAGMGMHGAVAD